MDEREKWPHSPFWRKIHALKLAICYLITYTGTGTYTRWNFDANIVVIKVYVNKNLKQIND